MNLPPPPTARALAAHTFPWTWNAAPRRAGDWVALATAVIVSVSIWIPTNAIYPRYSYDNSQQGSPWYLVLMPVAALLLAVVFTRSWYVLAAGLVLPQLLLAPWTTPRGDNDGLWAMIFPFLFAVGAGLHCFNCWFARERFALGVRRNGKA